MFRDSFYRGAAAGMYDGNEAAAVINKTLNSGARGLHIVKRALFSNNRKPYAAYGVGAAMGLGGAGMFNKGRQDGGVKGAMEMGTGVAMIGAGASMPFGGNRYLREGMTNVIRNIHGLKI